MFEGKKAVSWLSVLALACWASICFGEDAGDRNGKQGYVEAELEEIVVTATMTEKPAAEVPQAVTYISKDDIDSTGSLNTTDTFQRMPGVAVFDYGSNGFGNQLFVRGFDSARLQNNLDFQLDGITIHSQGDYGNPILNAIPRAAIDHIEFTRGTGASLYGQQASIGAIDSFVKRSFVPWSVEVTGGYGSYSQGYGGVGVSGSYENFGCTVAADYAKGGTYANEQSYHNSSFIFAPTVRVNSRTSIEGTVLVGERTVDNPSITPLTDAQIDQDRQQNFDRGKMKSPVTFVGLGVNNNLTESTRWVTKASYYHEREQQDLEGDGSGNSWFEGGFKADRPLDSYGVKSYLNFLDLGTPGSILTTGIEYHYDDAEQVTSWGGFPDKDAQASIANYSVYGQYEWKVLSGLNLTGGVRGDFYSTDYTSRIDPSISYSGQDQSAVSPRVGVNYEVFNNVNLYASFGTGFRVPSAYELSFSGSLDPEKSNNYEIGVKARVNKAWETTLAFYRTDYRDLIFYWKARNSSTGRWETVYGNAGEAQYQGIEWANYFNIGWGFTGYAHFLFDDSHFVDYKSASDARTPFDYSGNPIPYHPRHQVKMGIEYANSGWKIGLDGRYYGEYYSDSSGEYQAGDYFNLDMHASYTFSKITISIFLNNMCNKDYYASAYQDMQNPAPGRNVLAELKVKF